MSHTRRFGAIATTFAVIGMTTLAGCGGTASEAADTVTIGQLANLTGYSAAPYGLPFDRGLRLAMKDVKKSGMLDDSGLTLKLDTEDIASDETKAVTSYNKMSRSGVQAFVIPSHTPAVLALEPLVNDAKTMLLTATGGEPEPAEDNVFHLGAYATTQQNFAKDLTGRGFKKVAAIVQEDNPAFVLMANQFKKGLEGSGGSIVTEKSVAATDTNFSSLLTSIASQKPDVIFMSTLGEQAGNIISQMQQIDALKDVQVAGTVAWTSDVAKIAGAAAGGALFPTYWVPSDEKGKAFAESYEAAYGDEPTTYSGLGYEAGWLLASAIKVASADGGEVTGDSLTKAMPEAASSSEMTEHGLLEGFTMPASGIPEYPGSIATFDASGKIVPAE